MVVYDKAYNEIRSKYLLPLSSYSVPYRNLGNVNIKEILCKKSLGVTSDKSREYVFRFDRDDLYKGLLGDIELFYIRRIIQNQDVIACSSLSSISANWNIVTNYYNAFFTASLMLRFCHRGNIYLDKKIRDELDSLISYSIGQPIRLEPNQYYEVFEDDGELYLKLSSAEGSNTHEMVWKKMDELIDQLCMLSRPGSKEADFLKGIKKVNKSLQNTYPSQLRNRVNYQPQYGLRYLDNKIFSVNRNVSWVSYLQNFAKTEDDNQIACAMFSYTKYMEQFCDNLMAEYYLQKGNENGLIKKINEAKGERISVPKVVYQVE